MSFIAFHELYPEQGTQEVRVIRVQRHDRLPTDEYALVEFYCTDPQCDCRRVLLHILAKGQPQADPLAAIGYGFDRQDPDAGPYLDPMNPQGEHAEALLALVAEVALSDPAYTARLEAHYHQVKATMADTARNRSPLREVPTEEGSTAYDADTDTLSMDLPADPEGKGLFHGRGFAVRIKRRGPRMLLTIAQASTLLGEIAAHGAHQGGMVWRGVQSSMISAYGYDPETRVLEVAFNRNGVWRYHDVPPEVVDGLDKASSKGSYMRSMIIDQYRDEQK